MTTLATDFRQLVLLICRQFSDATDWRLRFTPAADETAEEVRSRLETDACCCWHSEIRSEFSVLGYLHLDVPEYHEPATTLEAVSTLANTLANFLSEFMLAVHQLDTSTRDFSTLVDLGLSVPAREDLPATLTDLLKAAVQLTETRSAAFFLLNPNTHSLRLRAVYQLAMEQIPMPTRELTVTQPDLYALTKGPIVLQRGETLDECWLPQESRGALCVPVVSESAPMGTIWIFDRRTRQFSDRQIHVMQSIAVQMAAVLERMVLLSESATQRRLSRELQVASENQPDDTLGNLPTDPRFEVAAHCVSAHELGGDLCELIPFSPDCTGIAIGDASGNSIPAALVMASARGALRTQHREDDDVAGIVARINLALHTITRSHHFMSLFYGVLDAAQKKLTYTNAGHPNPILVRGEKLSTLKSHGLLLGVLAETTYEESVVDLLPGDILVFYSDGISEAMNHSKELFRSEGIVSAIRGSFGKSATEVLHSVWSKVESHIQSGITPDDRTLMVLKILR